MNFTEEEKIVLYWVLQNWRAGNEYPWGMCELKVSDDHAHTIGEHIRNIVALLRGST